MSRPARPGRVETPALVAGVDVDRVAVAVAACPLVAGLLPGEHGTHATLLPGRKVEGIRVLADGPGTARVAVMVAAHYGAPMSRLVEQVRSAVGVHAPGHPVDVTVADVA
ncbi:hypothetical protein [Actinomycetospora atypica]|uniref:Asp23/Gls24 family envelope stress response protein n=1 Tax=Actinomycetospora atypica TaxID=1290095 RepID=A0ABV9YGC4_9PSEU